MIYSGDEEQLLIRAGECLNAGRNAEAIAIYESLMRESKNQSLLLFRSGLAEYRDGQQADGLEKMRSACDVHDGSTFAAFYENAVFHVAVLGDYFGAKAFFDRAINAQPGIDSTEYLIHSIQHCIKNQIDEEALDLTEKHIKQSPDDFRSWLWHGIALRYLGHIDRAVESLNRSLSLNAKYSETWEFLALLSFDTNNKELFANSLSNSKKLAAPANLALLLFQVGEFHEAAKHYRNIVKEFPQDEDAVFNLASCLYGSGEFSEAFVAIEKALKFSPGELYYLVIKKRTLLCMGESQLALRVAKQMIELFPAESRSWSEMSRLCSWEGDFESSLRHVNHAVSLSQPTAELFAAKAGVYTCLRDTQNALLNCESALKLNPNCYSALIKKTQVLCDDQQSTKSEIAEAGRCIDLAKTALSLRRNLLSFDALRAEASVLESTGLLSDAVTVRESILLDAHAPPWLKKLDKYHLSVLKETES